MSDAIKLALISLFAFIMAMIFANVGYHSNGALGAFYAMWSMAASAVSLWTGVFCILKVFKVKI